MTAERVLDRPSGKQFLVKRVVNCVESRPFDPMLVGVSAQDWLTIVPEVVWLRDLVLCQAFLSVDNLLERAANPHDPHSGDDFLHVCLWADEEWVKDGNHRAVIAAIQGRSTMLARVLRPDTSTAPPGQG